VPFGPKKLLPIPKHHEEIPETLLFYLSHLSLEFIFGMV